MSALTVVIEWGVNIPRQIHQDNTPRGIIIYARISREKVSGRDVSLEAQTNLGVSYADYNGMAVLAKFEEIQSAKSTHNRPEFLKALALVKKSKAVLFVYSLSRAFRSTNDALNVSDEIEKAGADLVSYCEKIETQTPSGKLFFTICAAFNAYERQVCSERTKTALAEKRNQNKRISHRIPFGFELAENGEDLLPLKDEEASIRRMMNLRTEGLSYERIARALDSEGVPTKTGARWSDKVVRGIVLRQKKLLDQV